MQRYRSGHNGADSKSVCGQPHVGSNPTRCANSEIPTTVPFPPWGENCTLVGIFLLSGRTRCAGSRPDFEADIRFASSGYVGARSAPLRSKAVPFGAALKLRSAPLLLLSNSNPLRWASSWLLVHDDRLHLYYQHMTRRSERYNACSGSFSAKGQGPQDQKDPAGLVFRC